MLFFPFAVFHGVHSYYTILWIFAEEHYGPGGGVDEAAGVRVRHLGQEEPGPLPGRGRNPHTIRIRTKNLLIRNKSHPVQFSERLTKLRRSVIRIRTGFNANPNPTFYLHAERIRIQQAKVLRTRVNPDPAQALPGAVTHLHLKFINMYYHTGVQE